MREFNYLGKRKKFETEWKMEHFKRKIRENWENLLKLITYVCIKRSEEG